MRSPGLMQPKGGAGLTGEARFDGFAAVEDEFERVGFEHGDMYGHDGPLGRPRGRPCRLKLIKCVPNPEAG